MSATTLRRTTSAGPDVETSGADYASRFAGRAGAFLLEAQWRAIERAIAGLTPGSVLDVGGGHGQLADRFAACGWDVTVHGTDTECERNLRRLHGRTRCRFLLGELDALPAPDRGYDLVIAVRLLSHATDWRAVLGEMCRVARRSVVFDYPATSGLNALTPLLFGLKRSLEGNTRTYASFRLGDLDAACARDGFRRARVVKQLFLPMVAHRVAKGSKLLQVAEGACRATGLTALAGSPAIYRADRVYGGRP